MIASGTHDVGMKRNEDGETKRYPTLTAYVWRILPSGEQDTDVPDERTEEAPAETATNVSPPEPATESAATPPPDVPDASVIPF
jgi:hypothetical protein